MPKILHLGAAIELPADVWLEAAQKVAIGPLWAAFTEGLTAASIKFETEVECSDVRAKRADAGKPRVRKPAADRPPRLVTQPEDAA